MCCSVLQCVAVCCSVLQCVAVCCSVLQCGLDVSRFNYSPSLEPHTEELWIQIITTTRISGRYVYLQQLLQQFQHE